MRGSPAPGSSGQIGSCQDVALVIGLGEEIGGRMDDASKVYPVLGRQQRTPASSLPLAAAVVLLE